MAWETKAILHAELTKNSIQRIPLPVVESYSIDTALDTDADSFEIEIGDPNAELRRLLSRDNEVQVNLFGGEKGKAEQLQFGIADEVGYTEEGTMVIRGRDISCIATDSMAKPHDYNHYRPHVAIEREARTLGFREFRLEKVQAISNFYTDGSETYWEKWYRAYRKQGRWMWVEPDGALRADTLHYTHKPTYLFGRPKGGGNARNWIPVETVEFTSRKQGRIGIAYVIGQRKDIGVFAQVADKTIKSWVRRPLQIFQDSDVHSQKDARKMAFEEIFESKVGAIEIIITIEHPGFLIRQNRSARLRIPQMDIDDDYFVVGVQNIGGPQGTIQKVRLRQKGFAISRRVPDDPKLDKGPKSDVAGAIGKALGVRWGDAFVSAAREFHGPWPFDLFLATLLALCKNETGFRNVRYAGHTEWYPPPRPNIEDVRSGNTLAKHHRLFANSRTNPLNPLYPSSEAAVGPMQLVTPEFKVWADEFGKKRGEYDGGRWHPESNIRAAARAFAGKLQGLPVSESNIFYAAGFRYYGSGSSAANQAYANTIKRYVMQDPGYLGIVREAQAKVSDDLDTKGGGSWGGSKAIADQFKKIGLKNGLQVISSKRDTKNTSTGGISDHWTGCKACYAYDLSNSSHPTPEMDKTAREIVRKLGGSYSGRTELVYSKIVDGYRVQVLYRTLVGGNHFNHVHVGVRKV